ncbi:MAG: universal stress protein [Geminicoccaceae bacterium]|nr:universal stress protein [Geminicoccaceae bacterium]MCB9945475.1 universal stress protein [Geminicoccaceae bacterium]
MTTIFLVGYGEADDSQRALDFAVERAKPAGAEIRLVFVLEWSPYSFLTPDELATRHKRRNEEVARATAMIEPVAQKAAASGVKVETIVRYGHVAEVLCDVAKETSAVQVFVGRGGSSSNLTTRLFGSVPGALVQASPIPVTVVP